MISFRHLLDPAAGKATGPGCLCCIIFFGAPAVLSNHEATVLVIQHLLGRPNAVSKV